MLLTILLAGAGTGAAVRADDRQVDFAFDILLVDDSVTAWVDLSGLLRTPVIERIEDGIDHAIECRASLNRPRRLFGAVKAAETGRAWLLSYRILTELWVLRPLGVDSTEERSFSSLAGLAEYLADSITIPLIKADSLETERRYFLKLEITSISLAGIGINPAPGDVDGGPSFLSTLFSGFLEITGYGRETFKIESRPFSPAEILPRP